LLICLVVCVVMCFVFVWFIGLRHVFCVLHAAIVSGLSILGCSFGFILTLIISSECNVHRVDSVYIVEDHSLIHQGVLVMYNDDDNGFIYNWNGVEHIYHMPRTVGMV
jgi:hypothetical protein